MEGFMLRVLTLALLTSCAASPVAAMDCQSTAEITQKLIDKGYQLVFLGIAENADLTTWVSNVGWVAIVNMRDGKSCLVGAGNEWQLKQTGTPS
jgi:hypothetical protein